MHRLLVIVSFFLIGFGLRAAEQESLRDLTKWQEVTVPPESPQGAHMVWFYAANYSKLEWRVFIKDGKPCATDGEGTTKKIPNRPTFTTQAEKFQEASAFASVDDGWLVGFNQGEFGSALYWFSRDGKQSYQISNHQVVDFFSLPDGVYAVEGLAHLGMSEGSVIRIAQPKAGARWATTEVAKLPFAPYAISLRRDGTMLITLSDALVSIGPDLKIHTLLADAPWRGLYPNSSIVAPGEGRLYIGMRQFVGEFDLTTNKLRFLIPSKELINKLPKEDEERMRKQYGG